MYRRPLASLLIGCLLLACCRKQDSGLAALRAKAAASRGQERMAEQVQQQQADQEAHAQAIADSADKAGRLKAVAAVLNDAAAKLDAGVTAAPDYGAEAVANTARLTALPVAQRAAEGSQILAATNQIDQARGQAASALTRIAQSASPVATDVHDFCAAPPLAFAAPCRDAAAAATAFDTALVHASTVFKGYKLAIFAELQSQGALIGAKP